MGGSKLFKAPGFLLGCGIPEAIFGGLIGFVNVLKNSLIFVEFVECAYRKLGAIALTPDGDRKINKTNFFFFNKAGFYWVFSFGSYADVFCVSENITSTIS